MNPKHVKHVLHKDGNRFQKFKRSVLKIGRVIVIANDKNEYP